MHSQRRLFHYTKGYNIRSIVESGELRLATIGVPKDERPVVWCSYNPFFEPTAKPGWIDPSTGQPGYLPFDHLAEASLGFYRIEVEPAAAPLRWQEYKAISGIKPRMAKALYGLAIQERSHPGDWRCSFEPIRKESWLAIEVLSGSEWVPADIENLPTPTE